MHGYAPIAREIEEEKKKKKMPKMNAMHERWVSICSYTYLETRRFKRP